MKILLVSHADGGGGAAIAAYRLHQALRATGVESRMLVLRKTTDDPQVEQFFGSGWRMVRAGIQRQLAQKLVSRQHTANKVLHSPAMFRTGLADYINASDADVVNLHWICEEMISIEEIGKIRKPIVWTLHDTWAFCGAEHYFDPIGAPRFKEGYRSDNRPDGHSGWDIDRWVWQRKVKGWQDQWFHLVAPSQWMADQAKASVLFRDQHISVIPNGLSLDLFKPLDKKFARDAWNLPHDKKLILFGAVSSTSDPRKGFYYLQQALKELAGQGMSETMEVVVFGGGKSNVNHDIGMKTHYIGAARDNVSLAILYATADLFVTPSMQDNLPNTLVEAMACGLPCVGFSVGGIPEIINHGVNGFLVEPFSISELANSMAFLLKKLGGSEGDAMRNSARALAVAQYEEGVFAQRMMAVFNNLFEKPSVECNID